MTELASFAALLRHHRLAAGLSQEALAERAGLTAQAIGALERGQRRAPYQDTVRARADALGLGTVERTALEQAIARARRAAKTAAPAAFPGLPVPADPLVGR